jgi:WD40 repeat protein
LPRGRLCEKCGLEKSNADLDQANAQIEANAARRAADFDFANLPTTAANPGDSFTHLKALADALDSYRKQYQQLPERAFETLSTAVSLSYMSAADGQSDDRVLLAMPDPASKSGMLVVRSRASAQAWGVKVPRLVWGVEQAVSVASTGDTAVGGAGGYVGLADADRSKVRTRKVHPFAVSGIGFSTDGEWVATASAAGDMRVFRHSDFSAGSEIKDRILQFGNSFKLLTFLAVHRYMGEYPVREFAVSVAPHPGRASEKKDVTVLALTESGRLIRWDSPGLIGKQLGSLDQLCVGARNASGNLNLDINFTAIATNPATQEVWAAAGNSFGKVHEREFLNLGSTPGLIGISAASWNSTGDMLALGLRNGSVLVYGLDPNNTPSGLTKVLSIPGHSSAITTVSWHGEMLATGSIDGGARLWTLHLMPADREMLRRLANNAQLDIRNSSTPANPVEAYDGLIPLVKARLEQLDHGSSPSK